MDIKEILGKGAASDVISSLKEKSVEIPSWETLVNFYDPLKHKIVTDNVGRRDKIHKDGTKDIASRVHIGLEQLHSKRLAEFTVAIPVKRNYLNLESENESISATKREIVKAIEAIYSVARIDSENLKRVLSYYASCEICTVWYVVSKPNRFYGFDSKWKVKCRTFSPMDGVKLYPLLDEKGDMLAMSFEYEKKVKDEYVSFFETYTDDSIYRWKNSGGSWEGGLEADELPIGKIPCIYAWRPFPVYYGLSHIREEIEYTLSRNSDVIAYNSAPILHVSGGVKGQENKGESYRIFRTENGGNVSYVSWQQAIEALRYHVSSMFSLYWQQAQVPDISFENMKSLGNIGYDARMTLLADAHLKVGEEAGVLIEMFEREANVIKAFLGAMRPEWKDLLDEIDIEHVITPFIQQEESIHLQLIQKANGGKPVISQLDSISEYGHSSNPQATYEKIKEEESAASAGSMMDMLAGGSAV